LLEFVSQKPFVARAVKPAEPRVISALLSAGRLAKLRQFALQNGGSASRHAYPPEQDKRQYLS